MNTKLIGFIALGLITMVLCVATLLPVATRAIDDTIGGVKPEAIPETSAQDMMDIVKKIVNWVFTFLILTVVIMILVAGYMFVTGGANPETTGKARNVLMYALIGFAIAMLAKGIIALVSAFINKEVKNPLLDTGGGN